MGLDGNPVEVNPVNSTDITVDEPVYNGNKTYVLLRFRALRTSQAGRYTCQSIVSSPLSVRTATKNVVVTGEWLQAAVLLCCFGCCFHCCCCCGIVVVVFLLQRRTLLENVVAFCN